MTASFRHFVDKKRNPLEPIYIFSSAGDAVGC